MTPSVLLEIDGHALQLNTFNVTDRTIVATAQTTVAAPLFGPVHCMIRFSVCNITSVFAQNSLKISNHTPAVSVQCKFTN